MKYRNSLPDYDSMIYFKYEHVEELNLTFCMMVTLWISWVLLAAAGLFSISKDKIIHFWTQL